MTRMPKPRARCATSWPIRPKPMMPERLLVQLHAAEFRAIPGSADQRRVGLRHIPGQRQQQRHRVLGRGDDVRLRGVRYDDAAPGGRVDVDVVDPDARTGHDT